MADENENKNENENEKDSLDQDDIEDLLNKAGKSSGDESARESEKPEEKKSDDMEVSQDEIDALLSGIQDGEETTGGTDTVEQEDIDSLLTGIGAEEAAPPKEKPTKKVLEDKRIREKLEERKKTDLPNLDVILALQVPVIVHLAEKYLKLENISDLNVGTILEFEKPSEEYLDLLVNNKVIARGETVKVGEKFGLQIKQIKPIREKIKSLGSG